MAWELVTQLTGGSPDQVSGTHLVYDSKYNYKVSMSFSNPSSTSTISIKFSDASGDKATSSWLQNGAEQVLNLAALTNGVSYVVGLYQFTISPGPSTAIVISIYRELKNTAPTTPGAFTQPSGTLEIGDSKVIQWGASSDAESNLSKYILEVSVNGGVFSALANPTTNSYTYTVPTATSIKFRVKAVDSAGLESAYRESNVFTVTKPTYYWNKYSTALSYKDDGPWKGGITVSANWVNAYKNYSHQMAQNTYGGSGGSWFYDTQLSTNNVAYFIAADNKTIYRYTAQGNFRVNENVTSFEHWKSASDNTQTYSQGSIVQSGITGVDGTYPTNGRHTDGFWYVRGSRVNSSIAPPGAFTVPTTRKTFKPSEVAAITFGASTAPSLSLYEVDYRYNSTGAWTPLTYNNSLTRSLTITTDKTLKTLELRVRAKNTSNVYSDYVYSEQFAIEHNVAPTVSLTGPADNTTLYENDTLNIAGAAFDADADQSVTVYYQVNSEAKKVLATNLSQTQIALSKQLTFKGGKLYDGETALTGTLADGVAHILKVWAEDSEKASSAIVERTFYVVPNRAPLLTVDAIVPSGVVDADKFKISGTSSDLDANSNVTVTRRINDGNAVEIYNGPGGAWEFEISLSQLQVGENTIVIEVIDNYGAKTSKTIKLNKKEVKTPILQSVARYKITPPTGSAKGVLLFIERDEDMDFKVELSMTLAGEKEQYETLIADNTAPMPNSVGIVEDTYFHEATEPKDNIILKISTNRLDTTVNPKIHLISGAVE